MCRQECLKAALSGRYSVENLDLVFGQVASDPAELDAWSLDVAFLRGLFSSERLSVPDGDER
jgi:hypothetical protein